MRKKHIFYYDFAILFIPYDPYGAEGCSFTLPRPCAWFVSPAALILWNKKHKVSGTCLLKLVCKYWVALILFTLRKWV